MTIPEPPHEKTLPFVPPYPTQVVIGKAPPPPFARRWDWWKVSTALLGVLVIVAFLLGMTHTGGLAATNASEGSTGNPTGGEMLRPIPSPTLLPTSTPLPTSTTDHHTGAVIFAASGIGPGGYQWFNVTESFTITAWCLTQDNSPMTLAVGHANAGVTIFSVPCDGVGYENGPIWSGVPGTYGFAITTISLLGSAYDSKWGEWQVSVCDCTLPTG